MKALALASGLLLMPPVEEPPARYQGDPAPSIVVFTTPDAVDQVCRGPANVPDGMIALACTDQKNRVMILPNPCLFSDGYARLACHEVSHLNGWSHGAPRVR